MSSDNAAIYYEAAQSAVAMGELTDSGDNTFFQSADELWSNKSGYEPSVKPNGLVTGGAITPGAANDTVAVAALTCYLAGVLTSVSANSALSVPRPSVSNYQILSITVNSGGSLAVVEGAEHTAFSDTRGADGGPPLIPTTSIEIGWVKYSSQSEAIVLASEIKQIVGTSQERYDYPAWTQKRVNVTAGVIGYAGVEFVAALPDIHTGPTPKKVYASYYTPEFAEVPKTSDFVPPETTHSVSSTQIYGQTLGATSSTLNQGTFNYYPEDGISDAFVQQKNQNLWFKFKQNKLNSAYILAQGKLGIARSFPAADNISAACTVSAETSAVEVFA